MPISEPVVEQLTAATLKCKADDLAKLMADHTQLDWRPQLPRIQIPCLNLIGCRSGVFPVEGCEAVSHLIPGALHPSGAEAENRSEGTPTVPLS